MVDLRCFRRAGVAVALSCLAMPLLAQGQYPAPPVPGPYMLVPTPLAAPPVTPDPMAAAGSMLPGPPPGMRLPYWMQAPSPPGEPGQPGASGVVVSEGAPARFAPAAPVAPVAPEPGAGFGAAPSGYGQATPPGYFPGYYSQPPMAVMPAPPGGAGGVAQGYQPYVPQPYGAPPGWGQGRAGGGRQ